MFYIKQYMKKYLVITGIILLVLSNIYAQENTLKQTFTLEECLQYAETHNYSIQLNVIDDYIADVNLRQAKENIAPSVSASASQGFNFGNYEKSVGWNGNYGINAGMTLFNGLSNANKIKLSQLNVEQSKLQGESNTNSVRISVIQAFLAIMMNEELLAYQQQVLNASQEQMEQGRQQIEVGQILESDYKMLQAQYTSDLYTIENLRHNIESNYLTLKNLLSIDPSSEIAISRPDSATLFKNLELPELQEFMNRSVNYLPELKISENEVASAEYDVKIQKAGYYPTLSANAGISTGYNGSNLTSPNTGWGTQLWHGLGENIGLSLNIPIYQRGSVRNSVKLAEYRAQQAELQNKETVNKVNKELQQIYLDVAKSQNDFISAEAKKEAYLANYKTYSLRFRYGSVTAVDLIQQQTNFQNQLYQFMQAKYSYVLQRKILDVYMGIPVTL